MVLRSIFLRSPARRLGAQAEVTRDDAELIEQYRQLHARDIGYGQGSARLLGYIQLQVSHLAGVHTILDYGCGRSPLVDWLAKINDATAFRYDPAIPEYDVLPASKVDLVLNTDVLEHIPETSLDDLLRRIRSLSENAYFHIATAPAKTILPNGDNAHCTVRDGGWWARKLRAHYDVVRPCPVDRKERCSFVTWPERSVS